MKTVYSRKEQCCSKCKTVLRENHLNRESKSLDLTIYLYRCYNGHKSPRIYNTTIYLSRNIGSITPHITSLEIGHGIGWNISVRQNSSDEIPPRNIRSFGLFNRGTSYFSNKSALCYVPEKSESKNPGEKIISKILSARIILKLKKLGANIL